jgi:hypothetical protein
MTQNFWDDQFTLSPTHQRDDDDSWNVEEEVQRSENIQKGVRISEMDSVN